MLNFARVVIAPKTPPLEVDFTQRAGDSREQHLCKESFFYKFQRPLCATSTKSNKDVNTRIYIMTSSQCSGFSVSA